AICACASRQARQSSHCGARTGRSTRARHRKRCSTRATCSAGLGPPRRFGRSRTCSPRSGTLPANAISRLAAEISKLADAPVELERPSDPVHGDYATNVALRSAPGKKRAPREVAEELAERARGLASVDRSEVAGPGFVNVWVTRDWFAGALAEIDKEYGGGFAVPHARIQVELVSA